MVSPLMQPEHVMYCEAIVGGGPLQKLTGAHARRVVRFMIEVGIGRDSNTSETIV